MRCRRIRFKRRKRRYKQKGRGCKVATNCWRPHKQFGKGEPEYIYQVCKNLLLKIRKNKS